ncbi:MAG TPA: DUF5667 domain-containing protein [Candidatus Binatia bacterium]|nr:DUF5667 domain-containing protein [Candidatus Binatia bacterium]
MTERTTPHMTRDDERTALEDLLRRYADERLALAPEARERLRRRFLREAQRRALGLVPLEGQAARRAASTGRRRWLRRPAMALLAASLALVALAGVTAASSPGGPLYGLRLWAETLTLPADPQGRTQAELERLEARLSEAQAAAEHGNGAAVRAALEAYRETVASALQAAGSDLDRVDRLEIVLERHQVVLDTLADRLPAPAAEAVTQTMERNEATIEKIKGRGKPSPPPGPGASESPPSAAPSAPPPTEGPGGPPSPKPGRTPPGQGSPSP